MRCKCLLCRQYPRLRLFMAGLILGAGGMLYFYLGARAELQASNAAYESLWNYWNGQYPANAESHHGRRHHGGHSARIR